MAFFRRRDQSARVSLGGWAVRDPLPQTAPRRAPPTRAVGLPRSDRCARRPCSRRAADSYGTWGRPRGCEFSTLLISSLSDLGVSDPMQYGRRRGIGASASRCLRAPPQTVCRPEMPATVISMHIRYVLLAHPSPSGADEEDSLARLIPDLAVGKTIGELVYVKRLQIENGSVN